jgi:hypothetical protein
VTIDSSISAHDGGDREEAEVGGAAPQERLDTLTLHVAADKDGKDLGAALDSRTAVVAAGLQSGSSLLIEVAAPAFDPSLAGELYLHVADLTAACQLRWAVVFCVCCRGRRSR